MLDLYGCPKDKLSDPSFLFNFLDSFPARIGMTKVATPYVFRYQGKNDQESGYSGVVLIAESHISIHTFPDKDHVFVDIFSCKQFDTGHVRAELIKEFGAISHEETLLNEGIEYPNNISGATHLMSEERQVAQIHG